MPTQCEEDLKEYSKWFQSNLELRNPETKVYLDKTDVPMMSLEKVKGMLNTPTSEGFFPTSSVFDISI